MPTLHGAEVSPFVRKVRIVLAEKGIDYEINPVVHFALPEGYETLHPLKKIPVWSTDAGENLPDSSVIIAYLDKVSPEPRFLPEDPVECARATFLEEFSDSDLAPAIATIFLQKIAYPRFLGQEPNAKVIEKASGRLPALFAHLDEILGDRDFLVGDSFTVADAAVGSAFVNYHHAELEVDGATYPNLRRYADAMLCRPSIAALLAEEIEKYGGGNAAASA